MSAIRHQRITSFVRRGMRMTRAQTKAFTRLHSRFVLPLANADGVTSIAPIHRLDLARLYPHHAPDAPLIVEIGTGTGDQIIHAAATRPDVRFLAFEVWRPGVAQALMQAEKRDLNNLWFVEADAQQALRLLVPAATVDEVWTFFPDPWQKTRHHKRRIVNHQFAADVACVLRDEGVWRLATDWDNYASHMIHVLAADDHFDLYSKGRFAGRTLTKFEARAKKEGRFPFDLTAIRRPRQS